MEMGVLFVVFDQICVSFLLCSNKSKLGSREAACQTVTTRESQSRIACYVCVSNARQLTPSVQAHFNIMLLDLVIGRNRSMTKRLRSNLHDFCWTEFC